MFKYSSSGTMDSGSSMASSAPVRDWNGSGATSTTVNKSGSSLIDGLISGSKWNGPITYSAPDSLNDYQPGYFGGFDTSGFSAFTAQQMKAFHFALDARGSAAGFAVEGFTGLSVSFISGGSGAGTIRGANMNDANPTAYAYYPSNGDYGGDTFFGNNHAGLKTPAAGNYGWHTMLHELGHSLGLKHGHESGSVAGKLPSDRDSSEYSVMTYNTFVGDNASGYKYEHWGAPQTYMMLDIAALQHMYGANFTTNSGNTTYKWNPNSGDTLVNGRVAVDAGGNRIFATIWDGGGVDTYDLAAYNTALRINLTPGSHSVFSDVQLAFLGGGPNGGYARGNIFNALQHKGDARSLIENARGGSGNDTIIGNKANNTLWGNGGNDKLYGGVGNDKLYGSSGNDVLYGGVGNDFLDGGTGNDILNGGAGADQLRGGPGFDTVTYAGAKTGVVANLVNSAKNTGDAAGDTYSSIENLVGTNFADTLVGNGGANRLTGGAGNDKLYGGNSHDILDGGAGADLLHGGAGNDTVTYASARAGVTVNLAKPGANKGDARGDKFSSIENIEGSKYADRLSGNGLSNHIEGGNGNDYLYGINGHDRLYGGNGIDRLYGGSGIDQLFGGAGNDYLYGESGIDKLYGGAGVDRLYGGTDNDYLFGDAGNDMLYGGHDNDRLFGGAGVDRLYGDTGSDLLYGGADNDYLYGGAGDDTLYGGTGTDYAFFTGNLGSYNISTVNGVTTVTHLFGGSDGVDQLIGVEYVVFSDHTVLL